MKQIQKLIVEFVKQFGPSSGKQLLNITDYIAKSVLKSLVNGEDSEKLELLRENVDNDNNVYQNGSYIRNVKWGQEEIPIRMKRIRGENQDSQIIPKYQRIIHDKFILDVLSLASTRLSNNEIADQITAMYGFKEFFRNLKLYPNCSGRSAWLARKTARKQLPNHNDWR